MEYFVNINGIDVEARFDEACIDNISKDSVQCTGSFCMPKVNHFCNLLFPPAMFSIVLFLIFPWGKPCHFTESLDKIAG